MRPDPNTPREDPRDQDDDAPHRQFKGPLDDQLVDKICDLIAAGHSLPAICKMSDMPGRESLQRARRKNPDIDEQISKALLFHCEYIAEEIIFIADTDPDPQRAKNRIDARKWRTAVLKPKTFGPKLDVTIEDKTDFAAMRAQAVARVVAMGKTAGVVAQEMMEKGSLSLPLPHAPEVIDVIPATEVSVQQQQDEDPFA